MTLSNLHLPDGRFPSRAQSQGIRAILTRWDTDHANGDRRGLAYMLATVFHETAHTFQPVRETLATSDDAAIAILDRAFAAGRLPWVRTPYWRQDADGKTWLGRGLVQITHRTNYARLGKAIGEDLLTDPNRALDMEVALRIMFTGMTQGLFTGRKLSDYFNSRKEDWSGARAIINGRESAEKVARYAKAFYTEMNTAA